MPSVAQAGSNPSMASSALMLDLGQSKATNGSLKSENERRAIERRCVLWVHDEAFSKEEVLLNLKLFQRDDLKVGERMAIVALKTDTIGVRDFQNKDRSAKKGHNDISASVHLDASLLDVPLSREGLGKEALHNADDEKRYIFAVKDMGSETRSKQPHLEISISKHIADAFGFKNRSNVLLSTVSVLCTVTQTS